MHTVQFVLCDDQQAHNQTLSLMLKTVIAEYALDARVALATTRAEEALAFARTDTGRTIYFLDICLDENALDDPRGIALCNGIRARSPAARIIYISAYQQYALECCHTHAFDFIVKPFSVGQLANCVLAAMTELRQTRPGLALYVTAGSRTLALEQLDILCFEKKREYVTARFQDAPDVVWREGFKELSARLEPGLFVKIHKSVLVNVRRIADVDWGEGICRLTNGARLRVSRRNEPALRALLTKGAARA